MLFILLLGVITAFVSLSGGSRAFAEWAIHRIKTKRGAKLLTVALGLAIFVDDYFNALAVGQIARPITDQHRVSRAKLAYFIDSTSAPICVDFTDIELGCIFNRTTGHYLCRFSSHHLFTIIGIYHDGADEFLRRSNSCNGIFPCMDEF